MFYCIPFTVYERASLPSCDGVPRRNVVFTKESCLLVTFIFLDYVLNFSLLALKFKKLVLKCLTFLILYLIITGIRGIALQIDLVLSYNELSKGGPLAYHFVRLSIFWEKILF